MIFIIEQFGFLSRFRNFAFILYLFFSLINDLTGFVEMYGTVCVHVVYFFNMSTLYNSFSVRFSIDMLLMILQNGVSYR